VIQIASQKNGETQLSESFEPLMSSLIADLVKLNLQDSERISRDLRVRLLADSSGNWELLLSASTDSLAYKTAPSLR